MEASTYSIANEEQIREIAYLIWEQAGRPAGQADWHWEMAKQAGASAEPKRAKPKAGAAKTVAKTAAVKRRAPVKFKQGEASPAMA
jgi:hypothetical protein